MKTFKNYETDEIVHINEEEIDTIYNMCGVGFYKNGDELNPVSTEMTACWYTSEGKNINPNVFIWGGSYCFEKPEQLYDEAGNEIEIYSSHERQVHFYHDGHNFHVRVLEDNLDNCEWFEIEEDDSETLETYVHEVGGE